MPVVPFVIEVTYAGSYGARSWANIQHLVWDEPTAGRDGAALGLLALSVEAAFVENIMTVQSANVVLDSVTVSDLNDVDGLTVVQSSVSNGDLSTDSMPGNVAVLATKIDAHGHSMRPGRQFYIGMTEGQTSAADPSALNAAGLIAWQGACSGFHTDLSGVNSGSDYYPVVLHKAPSPSGFTPFAQTDLVVSSRLATQRRRLRG